MAVFGSPLIVWHGPHRYAFPSNRDVTIGSNGSADIQLHGLGGLAEPQVLLHFNGVEWIAVDRSEAGMYVDGVRMATVFIHEGRAITFGHPQHGPRLVFQLPAPPDLAPPAPPPHAPPFAPAPQPFAPARPPRPPAPQPFVPAPPPPPPVRPQAPPPPPPPAPMRPQAPPPPPPARPAPHFQPPPPPPVSPPSAPPPPRQPVRWVPPPPRPVPPAVDPRPPQPPLPPPTTHDVATTTATNTSTLTAGLGAAAQKLRKLKPPVRPRKQAEPAAAPKPSSEPPIDSAKPEPTAISGTLEARRVRLSVDGDQALADLSFTASPGTITSVVGLSEASTSALVDVLAGAVRPSIGEVDFDGHDVADDDVRPHVGVVPRHDLLRHQLTVEQGLRFAAELRLTSATSAERKEAVRSVLDKLGLAELRTARAGTLTVEQRKRASIAVELLSDPALIVLDEPTADLEPEAAQRITATLRQLADEGRVVLEATTAPTELDVCDQVVLLTPTGIPVFAGAPSQIGPQLGTNDWSEIVRRARDDPYGAHDEYLARRAEPPPSEPPSAPSEPPSAPAVKRNIVRQIGLSIRRQAWQMIGDQRYSTFLAMLPAIFGAIIVLIPDDAGLGPASRYGKHPDQALTILGVLLLGAVVMGTALGVRELFGEQRIFRREQAHGLSATAFLTGKVVVYSLIAMAQTAVITVVATVGHKAPTHGAVLLGHNKFAASAELFLALTVTVVVTALVALAFSARAGYYEQILLIAVLIVMVSVVLAGVLFPIADRFPLEQLAALVPSRWGFAAMASTVDLHEVNPLAEADDSWKHTSGQWLLDMGLLISFGAIALAALRWKLRRPSRRHHQPPLS